MVFKVLPEGCPHTLVSSMAIIDKEVGLSFLESMHFNILQVLSILYLVNGLLPVNMFLSGITDITDL